jgi:hypothetical protein
MLRIRIYIVLICLAGVGMYGVLPTVSTLVAMDWGRRP